MADDEQWRAFLAEQIAPPREQVYKPKRDSQFVLERIEWQLNQIRGAVIVVALILMLGGFVVVQVSSGP